VKKINGTSELEECPPLSTAKTENSGEKYLQYKNTRNFTAKQHYTHF
jgi:hypothetical protein